MTDSNLQALQPSSGGTAIGTITVTDGTGTQVRVSKVHAVDATGAATGTAANPIVTSVTSAALPTGAATEISVAGIRTDLGSDGGANPANGSGVRGWLRSISDKLSATLVTSLSQVNGAAHSSSNPIFSDITDRTARILGAVTGTVTANQGTAGAQSWLTTADVTDRVARLLGKVGIQVAGVDVSTTNRVPSDSYIAGAIQSIGNPAPDSMYTASGSRPLYPSMDSYALNMASGAIGAITAGTTVFTMRNTGTRTAYIRKISLASCFLGTIAATVSHFQIQKFTTATPTGGTALVVGKKKTAGAVSTIGDARFAVTGLTTTSVAFTDIIAGLTQISQLVVGAILLIAEPDHNAFGTIELAVGEGICIRAVAATTIASTNLNLTIEWDEA